MRANWLDENDQPGGAISGDELAREGIPNQSVSTQPEDYQQMLDGLKREHGYVEQDEVALTPDMPNLEQVCAKFADEHLHEEDEVRFVLEGAGVFEIRSLDDRWMRVRVDRGDLIVVPANRYHRFFLTDASTIRCVRLFQDASGWVPHYRAA